MKSKIKYALFLTSIITLVLFSCKKEPQPYVYKGYDYFPANVGHYVIYECDSTVHSNGYGNSYYKFQIKEVIDSIFNNAQGQPTMRIVRYKRTNNSTPWSNILLPERVLTANLLPTLAKRQDDNYVYVKLVFPMTSYETWNGNTFNTYGTSLGNYQYTTLNTPYTLTNSTGSVHFDSTLTVFQYTNSNLLNYAYYYEQYATGVGLIKKVSNWDTSTVFSASAPPDTTLVTTYGVWYTETYLSSGNQ